MNRSEWTNLEEGSVSRDVRTDVCIVGAGAAGIYLATELSLRGIDVILIEAGPDSSLSSNEVGFMPEFVDEVYPGATKGRYFGMGGTTSRWGGLLIPHTTHNSRSEDPFIEEWSTIVDRVASQSASVLSRLGYRRAVSFESFPERKLGDKKLLWQKSGIDIQASLYIPFRRKNLVGVLKEASTSHPPRIFFNSVAKEWQSHWISSDSAYIDSLVAVSRNQNSLRVTARRFVIAAGAIESARTLLELNRSIGGEGLKPGAATGFYLADHLSIPIADVSYDDIVQTQQLFAPYFEGDWMRGFRFVKRAMKDSNPLYFAHFIFPQDGAGFTVAKELLGSLQKRKWPEMNLGSMLRGIGGLSRLAYHRFFFSRLYVPTMSPIHLQLDMEQLRSRENKVSLSSTVDEFGRFRARIDWKITDADMASISESACELLSMWPSYREGLPSLIPRPIDREVNKPYDAYHPVGTCRMGIDSESVVNRDLKVWGTENLWVVSTAVLPGAGTANPTFTMLCLAQDLVEKLSRSE